MTYPSYTGISWLMGPESPVVLMHSHFLGPQISVLQDGGKPCAGDVVWPRPLLSLLSCLYHIPFFPMSPQPVTQHNVPEGKFVEVGAREPGWTLLEMFTGFVSFSRAMSAPALML